MAAKPHKIAVVIPCYNEANRLKEASLRVFLAQPRVSILLVNDGSRDNTLSTLKNLERSSPGRVKILSLEKNRGKAEAVRRGLLEALKNGATLVGYFDPDFATPPEEMLRLFQELEVRSLNVVLGSRVKLLGTDIARRAPRHYLGRVFATFASWCLRLAVYDTQCGAKVFRRTAQLEAALKSPFYSSWAFDVELIGRLEIGVGGTRGTPIETFREVPLEAWEDKGDSKVRWSDMPKILWHLLVINWHLSGLRKAARALPAEKIEPWKEERKKPSPRSSAGR